MVGVQVHCHVCVQQMCYSGQYKILSKFLLLHVDCLNKNNLIIVPSCVVFSFDEFCVILMSNFFVVFGCL